MADLKNIAPLEDFDWEAYEQGDNNANESREAQTEAYEGSLNKVGDHDVVDGTVISMNKREVVVNIGYKSDGIIWFLESCDLSVMTVSFVMSLSHWIMCTFTLLEKLSVLFSIS